MGVFGGAVLGDPLQVTALPECVQRIFGQSFRFALFLDRWPHVGSEGVLQAGLSLHEITFLLRRC